MIAFVVPFTTEMAADPATPTLEAPTPDIVWVEILCPMPSSSSLLPNNAAMALRDNAMISWRCCGSLMLVMMVLAVFFTASAMTAASLRPSEILDMVSLTNSCKSSSTLSSTSVPFRAACRRAMTASARPSAISSIFVMPRSSSCFFR